MRRARDAIPVAGAHLGVWLALVLLAAALLLNTAAIYLVNRDHSLLGYWFSRPMVAPTSVIVTLEREFDLRIASRLIVSVILIFSAMVSFPMSPVGDRSS